MHDRGNAVRSTSDARAMLRAPTLLFIIVHPARQHESPWAEPAILYSLDRIFVPLVQLTEARVQLEWAFKASFHVTFSRKDRLLYSELYSVSVRLPSVCWQSFQMRSQSSSSSAHHASGTLVASFIAFLRLRTWFAHCTDYVVITRFQEPNAFPQELDYHLESVSSFSFLAGSRRIWW